MPVKNLNPKHRNVKICQIAIVNFCALCIILLSFESISNPVSSDLIHHLFEEPDSELYSGTIFEFGGLDVGPQVTNDPNPTSSSDVVAEVNDHTLDKRAKELLLRNIECAHTGVTESIKQLEQELKSQLQGRSAFVLEEEKYVTFASLYDAYLENLRSLISNSYALALIRATESPWYPPSDLGGNEQAGNDLYSNLPPELRKIIRNKVVGDFATLYYTATAQGQGLEYHLKNLRYVEHHIPFSACLKPLLKIILFWREYPIFEADMQRQLAENEDFQSALLIHVAPTNIHMWEMTSMVKHSEPSIQFLLSEVYQYENTYPMKSFEAFFMISPYW